MSDCSIYIIGEPEAKVRKAFIKVGISSDTRRRLKNIKTSCPIHVETLQEWLLPSRLHAYGIEQRVHREFSAVRASGEWMFVNAGDVVEAIDQIVGPLYEVWGWA